MFWRREEGKWKLLVANFVYDHKLYALLEADMYLNIFFCINFPTVTSSLQSNDSLII